MPVIWDRVRNVIDVGGDFELSGNNRMLMFDHNHQPKIVDARHLRGVIIDQLIISHDTWEKFNHSMIWANLAPCLRPGGLTIKFTDYKINGLVFYGLDAKLEL